MSAKHTPNCERIGNAVRSSMPPIDKNAPRGILIADFRDGYGLPHTDEARANAALFVAAPALLEVAKGVLADDLLQYLPAEYIAKVRAAISAAEESEA